MKVKYAVFLLFVLFLSISAVCAGECNSSDTTLNETALSDGENSGLNSNISDEKTCPEITITSSDLKAKDNLEINLLNSTGSPLKSKEINATFNNKTYFLKTDSKGTANLPINLPAASYKLIVSFAGDEDYNNVTKEFTIKVSKIKTKITESANYALKNKYVYFQLTDVNGNSLSGKKVTVTVNGKKYTKKTMSSGKISVKIPFLKSKSTVKVRFGGNSQYGSVSKKVTVCLIKKSMGITIGNSKILTNGYVRIYLKQAGKALSKKTVTLIIGNTKFKKKTTSEGIAVFKPKVKQGAYTVKAVYGKFYSAKYIKCYEGNVKDPLTDSVVCKNGKPDIDVMPGNYVMGDGNAKYTLKKSQYREVLKRDSYCLFLNNKLTKYVFFKTKSHPQTNHIIKREKWNVIERAINTKLVKMNRNGYWPGKITVSLKGKSYKYPEVRDPQNTPYTCGPTSCSVCSQVLKNYVCERHIAKLAKTDRDGTSCGDMINALRRYSFDATYFYKSTFNKALSELKKGGCALIFHAYNHYVTILDISKDSKKVLVSNSYGSYDNIPTKWLKVSYMKNKFSKQWDDSLIVRLNYKLSDSTVKQINNYYSSMGKNWVAQNIHYSIGTI